MYFEACAIALARQRFIRPQPYAATQKLTPLRHQGTDQVMFPATDTERDDDLVVQWLSLIRTAARFGLDVARVPGGSAGVDLLSNLLGLPDAESRALASIKSDTRLLREGPLRSATSLLGDARRVGPQHDRYRYFLELSYAKLRDAEALTASDQELAAVRFHVSVVMLLLGDGSEAAHWIGLARGSARRAVEEIVRAPGLRQFPFRDLRSGVGARRVNWRNGIRYMAAVGGLMAVPLTAGVEVALERADKRRIAQLNRMLAFAHFIEATAAEMHGEVAPPLLSISLFEEAAVGDSVEDPRDRTSPVLRRRTSAYYRLAAITETSVA